MEFLDSVCLVSCVLVAASVNASLPSAIIERALGSTGDIPFIVILRVSRVDWSVRIHIQTHKMQLKAEEGKTNARRAGSAADEDPETNSGAQQLQPKG
jgi:hypothetical protein